MSASQRRKGAAGEREVFALLSDELGFDVCRKLGQARDGGFDGQAGRFAIEVKRRERLDLPGAWRQVNAACGILIPTVAFRESRQPWRFLTCWNWYQPGFDKTYANAILATLPAFAAMVRETL